MSVTANSKGAVEQRVNLLKRGPGQIQHVMLNSTLIKKAENYGLMTDRFITNEVPGIFQRTWPNADAEALVQISPRRRGDFAHQDPDDGFDPLYANEMYFDRRSRFQPGPIYSVARLCEALALFFKDFNFGIFVQGIDFSDSINDYFAGDAEFMVPQHANMVGADPIDVGNDIDPEDITKHVTLGYSPDGNLQLSMSSQFLSNFYIVLDPIFSRP